MPCSYPCDAPAPSARNIITGTEREQWRLPKWSERLVECPPQTRCQEDRGARLRCPTQIVSGYLPTASASVGNGVSNQLRSQDRRTVQAIYSATTGAGSAPRSGFSGIRVSAAN